MGELVKLPGAALPDAPEPSKEIIAYLEKLLEEAKKGEVQAFAFAIVNNNLTGRNSFYLADPDARSDLVANVAYLSVQLAIDAGAIEEEYEAGGDNGC